MCGIVGTYKFHGEFQDLDALKHATESLQHRGPDSSGTFIHGGVGLGHRRLSIIDTSEAGAQPFTEDSGRYTIVFNGEIYNYRALREELKAKGHTFRSDCDTEVLLKGYAEHGAAVMQKLNGFFAFAIYDKSDNSLFLARDRFGIKPLYWSEHNGAFHFASELKALIKLGIQKELDSSSLAMLLQLSYIPAPYSIFKGTHKLLPGHSILVKNGQIKVERYYDPRTARSIVVSNDPEAQLRELMERSVERRLISDVPLGSFLSGGVDSSIIAAIAAKKVNGFKTFSIGFPEHPKYDESGYAEEVARYIGSDHTSFLIQEEDLKAHYMKVVEHLDEPFADSSTIPVSVLSQMTKQHVSVALSGDGADEVFSGYNKHRAEWKLRNGGLSVAAVKGLSSLWSGMKGERGSKSGDLFRKLDRFAKGSKMSNRDRYWQWASFTDQKMALSLMVEKPKVKELQERLDNIMGYSDPTDLNELLLNDIMNVLPNDMLKKVDSMSMAHSLEVRTPFLDHEVVEFANALPVERKFGNGDLKSILRNAYRNQLPEQVFKRPKHGFEVPLQKWFEGPMYEWVENTLSEDLGILDQAQLRPLLEGLKKGQAGDTQATIHALSVLQTWWKSNVRG